MADEIYDPYPRLLQAVQTAQTARAAHHAKPDDDAVGLVWVHAEDELLHVIRGFCAAEQITDSLICLLNGWDEVMLD